MNHATEDAPHLPEPAQRVVSRIEASRRPLLTSHIRLDGDAIGAELGLAHILRARGAEPHVVNDGIVPEVYRFLPGAEGVATSPDALHDDYDLVIALDIPSRDRAGGIFERLPPEVPVVAVDHHPVTASISDTEWKDSTKSCIGEMVLEMAQAAGWRIPPEAAACLYAAILTDTGRFTYGNTTAAALRAAARLIELGADHVQIGEHIYQREPLRLLALRAEAMLGIRLHAEGRIAVMRLTREMFARHNVDPTDTADFAGIPRDLAGVVVGVLLREMDDKVKVSLRSRSGVAIEPVARQFGGGGHRSAAGCEVSGQLDDVEKRVVAALSSSLGNHKSEGSV